MNNPSLREETRYQRAIPIPPTRGSSILEWLENTGRFMVRDTHDITYLDSDDPEISELMGDSSFVVDDDDDFAADFEAEE
jgi:hypothetical protein